MFKKYEEIKRIIKLEKEKNLLKKIFIKPNESLIEFLDNFFYNIENNIANYYVQKEHIEILYSIIELYKYRIKKEKFIEQIQKHNKLFIEEEKKKYKNLFDTIESNPLTEKQREAIISNEKNNLILAGAGSGKTSVVMAKVKYLIESGLAKKDEILILAFNTDAAKEIKERIMEKIGIDVLSFTFHSFGNLIVREKFKSNLVEWLNESKDDKDKEYTNFDDLIKDIILNYLKNSKNGFLEKIFALKKSKISRGNNFNKHIPLNEYLKIIFKDSDNRQEFKDDLKYLQRSENLYDVFLYKIEYYNYKTESTDIKIISIFEGILPEIKYILSMMNSYGYDLKWLEDVYNKKDTTNFQKILITLTSIVYTGYSKYKESKNYIDFDDMIYLANKAILEGKYKKGFKYIIVDEFQDISLSRLNLVKNVRNLNKESIVMAVGDDWQAINGFAGSDVSIIQNFEKYLGDTNIVKLDMTFRYNQAISDIAANFVTKNEIQVNKDVKSIKTINEPAIYIHEYYCKQEEKYNMIHYEVEIILNYIEKYIDNVNEVLLLGRYKRQKPWGFNEWIKKYKHDFKVTFQTVHSSKGREADIVIILPMDTKEFQFPSLKKKTASELLFFNNKEFQETYSYAEERRLFYVGITRTKNIVYILSDGSNRSSFVNEIIDDNQDDVKVITIESEGIKREKMTK